jgi:hypothetical protein
MNVHHQSEINAATEMAGFLFHGVTHNRFMDLGCARCRDLRAKARAARAEVEAYRQDFAKRLPDQSTFAGYSAAYNRWSKTVLALLDHWKSHPRP